MASGVEVLNPEEFEERDELKPGGQSIKIKVCFWRKRGLWVVLKMIRLTGTYTEEHFRREVQVLAAAQCDCVIIFHGIFQQSETGVMVIVLELASGGDLSGAIGSLTPTQQASIMFDVLRALQLLHSKNILHLDLKPANVLLNKRRRRARLTDFGAARIRADGETVMTRSIMTQNYAAPEVIFGVVTKVADIWSFGVTLFEVLSRGPMRPAANVQFQSRSGIDLSGIANPRARELISQCLGHWEDRLTIEQLVAKFDASIFGLEAVKRPIVVKLSAGARAIVSSDVVSPAESATPSPAPHAAAPITTAPVYSRDEFWERWSDSDGDEWDQVTVRWVRKLAEGGDANAMLDLASDYCWGHGVEQDLSAAASWFRKSADGGNTVGMLQLAWCYEEGHGVEKDWRAAASWCRKSAEGGEISGMYELGCCYKYGCGVEKDLSAAVSWFRKSAEGGDIEGREELAECYRDGCGVEKDEALTNFWFEKAHGWA